MTVTGAIRGATRIGLSSWRSAYDFDSSGISARGRVERLWRAVLVAQSCRTDAGDLAELAYARSECVALLDLPSLDGEDADRERVGQRVARIRRIVIHHEGAVARLNRRYWWMPFGIALAIMAVACVSDMAARLGSGAFW